MDRRKNLLTFFKRTFRKLRREEGRWESLQLMLKTYRNTPRPGGKTPAELFLNREIRTELSLLQPEPGASTQTAGHGAAREQRKPANRREGRRTRSFSPGDQVYAKDYRVINTPCWTAGRVVRRNGTVMYDVEVEGLMWSRHINQLKQRSVGDFQTAAAGASKCLLRAMARIAAAPPRPTPSVPREASSGDDGFGASWSFPSRTAEREAEAFHKTSLQAGSGPTEKELSERLGSLRS